MTTLPILSQAHESTSRDKQAVRGRYALITLGCPKNLVDSERMLGCLEIDGYVLVAEPSGADFATFLEALLGGQLLGQERVSEMLEWREPARYGLGINYIETPYGPGIGHTGGDLGAMSQVRHFPDVDATLVLLMNGGDGGVTARLFWSLWDEAMELAL